MKTLLLFTTVFLVFAAKAAFADNVIEAARNGDVKISQPQSFATLLQFPLKTIQSPLELGQKYVILSNGTIDAPAISPPCTGFQVYQSSLYQGLISSVTLDLQNTSGNCDSEVQKVLNADVVTVTFKTALLADGSGTDVAPIVLNIHK